jgi:hypothetical protein
MGEARMTLEERANLVLAFGKVLYVNGQDTDRTIAAAERLGDALGLRVRIMPGWGELQLRSEGNDPKLMCLMEANPVGINMTRVGSAMRVVGAIEAGRLTPQVANKAIEAISRAPSAPTALFALASGAGAVALAVIFGIEHPVATGCRAASRAAFSVSSRSCPRPAAVCPTASHTRTPDGAGIIGAPELRRAGTHRYVDASIDDHTPPVHQHDLKAPRRRRHRRSNVGHDHCRHKPRFRRLRPCSGDRRGAT